MGDRMGGREAKGSSLKKSKKNPGCATAKMKKEKKVDPVGPSFSAPPPVPIVGDYFDCGAALSSRQFDRDRDRVLTRATTDGVCSIINWFSDIEKLSTLIDLAKSNNPGFCYFFAGAHPDNVDKTNKKSHEGWLEKVEEAARRPECVGILTGLNLTREMATHFAQESLLRAHLALADKLLLPVVLHVADGQSLEKAIEILRVEGWATDSSDVGNTALGLAGISIAPSGLRRVLLHDAVTACGGKKP